MVEPATTHSLCTMVHARVVPGGETEGRLHPKFPLVEEGVSQDGEHTCYTPFCNYSGDNFDGHIRAGGIRDTTVQRSRTQDNREFFLVSPFVKFAEM